MRAPFFQIVASRAAHGKRWFRYDAPLADRFLQLLKCLGEEVERLRGEKARLLEQNDLLQASLLCFADRRFKLNWRTSLAYKDIDPTTGRRRKSGGRVRGSMNVEKRLRLEAEMRVNDALIAMGEDSLTRAQASVSDSESSANTSVNPLECAALLSRYETTPAEGGQNFVVYMPPAMPTEGDQAQAVWWALYGQTESDDPEWTAACKRVLELAATRKPPGASNEQQRLPNYHRPTRPHLLVEFHSKRPTPRSIPRIFDTK
jgi:hypothetical protein